MKPYTLTEADIQLLANFAGALNTGRAELPVADRFGNLATPATAAPSVKWSHADELAALVKRAQDGGPPTGPLVQFALAWGDGTRHPTKQIPLAWTTEIIVMELKVPAVGPFSTRGRTSVYEFDGGPPRAREMTVSNIAGDFANPLFRAGGVAAQIIWNVGAGGGDVQLDAGSKYYFNFRNSTSGEGNYDAAIETQFPHN